MTNNQCKKCGREIPHDEKSCTYCKNKHKDRNGNIIKGVVPFVLLAICIKKK